MDARLDVYSVLGLEEGDAHVIRNAGGVVTDDEIRSLAISQRLLGTREIVLIHHTDCGMLTFTDDEFAAGIAEETGVEPAWEARSFTDLDEDVRDSRSSGSRTTRSSRTPTGARLRVRRGDRPAARGRLTRSWRAGLARGPAQRSCETTSAGNAIDGQSRHSRSSA